MSGFIDLYINVQRRIISEENRKRQGSGLFGQASQKMLPNMIGNAHCTCCYCTRNNHKKLSLQQNIGANWIGGYWVGGKL